MIDFSIILQTLRIQDIFDILIIWIMTSVLLIWFKDRASRFVFIGISLLGVIYIIARFFQLYLTTLVLQGFFAILLFVLVVIFQEDLRRFFERLAMWGRIRRTFFEDKPVHRDSEILVQTISNLARKHIGALIVMKGHDPLDRHLNGGTPLDGAVSQPLLESIFDPHSIGHDGAVVIEGNRVARFGCHLPLSQNTGPHGSLGLRHTAALGLSERCDALNIVVSEERGTISIAKEEQIREISDISQLQQELEAYYDRMAPKKKDRPIRKWLRENSREKIIALVLACILWIAFGYQKESVRRDFFVPVEYVNIPQDWEIEDPKTTKVQILMTGPQQAFQLFNPETLKLSLDLSKIRKGTQDVTFTADMIKTPSSLSVTSIHPARVSVTAWKMGSVFIPIQAVTEGAPPAGWSVQKITVTPASVKVLVSGKRRHYGMSIKTMPVNLARITSSATREVDLVYPPDIRIIGEKPSSAKVSIKLKKSGHPAKP